MGSGASLADASKGDALEEVKKSLTGASPEELKAIFSNLPPELKEKLQTATAPAEAAKEAAPAEPAPAEAAKEAAPAEAAKKDAPAAPALKRAVTEDAKAALNSITKASITELKSLAKPPAGVDQMIAVTCILIGEDPKKTEWKDLAKTMAASDFLTRCLAAEPTDAQIAAARAKKDEMGELFSVEAMEKKSKAAACLVPFAQSFL